jgi:uncharacterized protein
MNTGEVIKRVEDFAKRSTEGFDSGHDWWHLRRVRDLALRLQKAENKGDRLVIELSALLHDVNDKKFRKTVKSGTDMIISDLLSGCGLEDSVIQEVILINKYISFSSDTQLEDRSVEFLLVQDADRLDAIGAIGIARAFNYGGFKNNAIYIPENDPSSKSPSTIGHFYEKLLLLKNLMNTESAKKIAYERHLFLEKFLDQFYIEWNTGQ